jgi:TRAP-type C4-dicarboxylate transport system substrate-binding protein
MRFLEASVRSHRSRRASRAIGVAVLGALLAGSRASPILAETPLVIRMATFVPAGSSWYQILKETSDKWKTASGGRVSVRLFPGGVAGDDLEVVGKLRQGRLEAAMLTSAGIAEIDRSVHALSIPLLFDSYDEADYVLEKMRPRLEAGLAAKGFVVLHWADGGWMRFFAQTPVTVPDDLKATKLFSLAGDAASLELWRSAGMSPVSLPAGELSDALETSRVTALAAPPQLAVATQYFLHARHMTALRSQLLLGAALITKTAWDKVPADIRPALLEAARADGRRLRDEVRKSEDKDIAEMQRRGLAVVAVDAKARALWQKTAEAFYPRVRGTIVPAEAFDEALRFRDEYRKRPRGN